MTDTATVGFSPELEERLNQALEVLNRDDGGVVLLLFEDMVEIADHFQATLDWFKAHGNKMSQRLAQCAYMQKGIIYFVGADTHTVQTRGVDVEIDLQPYAHELVRQTGLEARLRKRGLLD